MIAEEMDWDYDSEAASEITRIVHVGLEANGIDGGADHISFTLIPLYSDLPLIYNWKLIKDQTNVIKDQTGDNTSFSIPKAYWGKKEYNIQVQISDPEKIDEVLLINIPLS